jgi:hypothetical protein
MRDQLQNQLHQLEVGHDLDAVSPGLGCTVLNEASTEKTPDLDSSLDKQTKSHPRPVLAFENKSREDVIATASTDAKVPQGHYAFFHNSLSVLKPKNVFESLSAPQFGG